MQTYPLPTFVIKKHGDTEYGIIEWGRARNSLFERYYEAVQINEVYTSIYELEQILEDDPYFLDAYNAIGWMEMDMLNYGLALDQFETARKKAQKFVPKNFQGLIEWGFSENRPFLRTLQGLGIGLLNIHQYKKAVKIFEQMLSYNPDDNQGIRMAAIHAYMALGNFNAILNLCARFPDDIMADVLYGKVYAYFRLDRLSEARKALEQAVQQSPNIAKEITKKSHKTVRVGMPFAYGSEEEAFDFWNRVGIFWTDPKLISFVKEAL